jgi:hypothetical protein
LAEIESLRHDYADLRPGNRLVETSERIDGLHHSLNRVHERLQKVSAGLGDVERSEMESLRIRFEHEVHEVASQRANLDDFAGDAQDVSAQITRDGFARIGAFFADSVLKADMGIVDVYWAQKLTTVDEISRVQGEKATLLDELDTRFSLIREKMGK